ncbi:DUF7948 domain-containing protein [Hymenobacter puniceus]|uniref:DUF7948 domain-containing protein n=1 Tax=Hymenobacter sp. BT190 TaxID=2763505 RepID=UPI0016518289|nr:PKD domain-containing protein [Hymenobacter sp. BT190]MBC6697696.1 gliding motility-associated C-terminal domain-containing protein [Hymenobacter sp. BT190]
MKKLLSLLMAFCLVPGVWAAEVPKSLFDFVANKGQWPTQVQFAADVPGGRLFLEPTGFSYNLVAPDHEQHTDAAASQPVRGHAFRAQLVGARSSSPVAGEQQLAAYHNYFVGNDPAKWASKVPLFQAVRYSQLYPGVDMVWHTAAGQLKYDYELAAGTDPARIRLRYEGLEQLELVDDALRLHTSMGVITEQPPIAWQTDAQGQRHPVKCRFVLRGHEVGFVVDRRNPRWPLTIDPSLVFSTYTSNSGGMSANVAAADAQGQTYVAGYVLTTPFPVTLGAYQTTMRGGNIGLMKLNAAGSGLLYATYLGGNSSEYPLDIAFNDAQEPFLLSLSSSFDYPLRPTGGFDRTLGGSQDYVISRLNTAGSQLLGSTYLGGFSSEGGSLSSIAASIVVAPGGDVLVGGTTSSSDFPTLNGVQNTKSSGIDGCITRFDSGLNQLRWSTYLGGSGLDQVHDLLLTADGSVYACGSTSSSNLPLGASGLNRTLLGGTDGFVVSLSSTGATLRNGTFLGTTQQDAARFLDVDASGRILVAGATAGSYPTTPGVFQSTNATSRLFIHCLNPTLGATAFATQLGMGSSSGFLDSNIVTGFGVDGCGRLLFSAYTTASNCPLSADALQRAPRSLYLGALSGNGQALVYGSYFGGPQGFQTHLHFAASNQITRNGDLYHVECTTSTQFPTTPGSYVSVRNVTGNAGAVFKFSFSGAAAPPQAAIRPVNPGCAPLLAQFINTSSGGNRYRWTFGDGSPIDTTFAPQHRYTQPGRYRARLEVEQRSTCGISRDTTSVLVVVTGPPPVRAAVPAVAPNCAPLLVQFGNTSSVSAASTNRYRWNFGDGSPIDTTFTPQHRYTQPGRYRARLEVEQRSTCGISRDTTSVIIEATAPIPVQYRSDSLDCAQPLVLEAYTPGNYLWSTGATSRSIAVQQPGSYSVTVAVAGKCDAVQRFEVRAIALRQPANIITPNGDGKNETFRLLGQLRGAEIRIFNRWGREVYHASRYDDSWQGEEQPTGLYYYLATRPECGLTFKGWLEVSR